MAAQPLPMIATLIGRALMTSSPRSNLAQATFPQHLRMDRYVALEHQQRFGERPAVDLPLIFEIVSAFGQLGRDVRLALREPQAAYQIQRVVLEQADFVVDSDVFQAAARTAPFAPDQTLIRRFA